MLFGVSVLRKIIFLQLAGVGFILGAPSYFQSPYVMSNLPTAADVKYNLQSGNLNNYKTTPDNTNANAAKFKKSTSFSNTAANYQNALFSPESEKRIQTYPSDFFNSIEDFQSTPSPGVISFPYTGQFPKPATTPQLIRSPAPGKSFPPTASSKIFIPSHHHHPGGPGGPEHHGFDHLFFHEKPHFIHDNVDLLTGVAGHKLKHAGEVLESGVLTEPIVHKLPFIKAALLQLLAIIGPLSAAKTIHTVAQASHASNPHDHHDEIPSPSGPSGAGALPGEPSGLGGEPLHQPHHPPTLVGLILNFMGQLSRFNTEAKLHLLPNLLKILSTSSTTSAHSSAHY